jgi:hypothetical protein
MPSPYARSQRVKIVLQHFHGELLVAWVTPAIAVDAANQHLTVVVDSYWRVIAVRADFIAYRLYSARGRPHCGSTAEHYACTAGIR